MKISTFLLSFCGLSVFYLCYADWIDQLLEGIAEDYLGFDYEEVAPFIPSVSSGTEEFDSIVEELSRTPRKDFCPNYLLAGVLAAATVLLALARSVPIGKLFDSVRGGFRHGSDSEPAGKLNGIGGESIEGKSKRFGWGMKGDEIPVRVIWRGNGLMESSVHCNLKEEVHGEGRPRRNDFGAGDVHGSPRNESTVQRLTEMRKLLESEPEMRKLVDKSAGTEDFSLDETDDRRESDGSETKGNSPSRPMRSLKAMGEDNCRTSLSSDSLSSGNGEEKDSAVDPKLMNRIKLLESRLRLEEIKNRNWITRMSRAEGILQQLNKQVERIEGSQPLETTLLETLKITSTVTKWMPVTQPRNLQLTMVKEYPRRQLFESLSEYIRKEISLPSPYPEPKSFISLPKPPLLKALPSPGLAPQSSILTKFLSK